MCRQLARRQRLPRRATRPRSAALRQIAACTWAAFAARSLSRIGPADQRPLTHANGSLGDPVVHVAHYSGRCSLHSPCFCSLSPGVLVPAFRQSVSFPPPPGAACALHPAPRWHGVHACSALPSTTLSIRPYVSAVAVAAVSDAVTVRLSVTGRWSTVPAMLTSTVSTHRPAPVRPTPSVASHARLDVHDR